ncbi:MAG: virulence RhuM family protein [Bacteroidales bacterium]|nr:virulence RhuM family protein [Candidatus Colicola equi]
MNEQTNITSQGELIIYQTEDGSTKLNVQLKDESVWLSLDQMAALFQRDKSVISRHVKNIFEEGELSRETTIAKFATVVNRGYRGAIDDQVAYYNLDVIISVGYRVKSVRGTQFRQWATKRIHEYIVKGFTMDDERLKGNAGGAYWKELLDRIRDIRSSEKVMYRQVLDLYATSADYNPKAEQSQLFFKIVQNKFHYAVHGHTAGELMVLRADAEKPFMGLQSFRGAQPTKAEVQVAKNYLDEPELKRLNNMVSAYFDIAEIQAEQHRPMMMQDFVSALDGLIRLSGGEVLQDAGHISMEQAKTKVLEEYRKYQTRTLSPVEEDYYQSLKQLKQATQEGK